MDEVLIKDVTIIDSTYSDELNTSILISNGKIKEISKNIKPSKDINIIEGDNQYILPGFIDMHVHLMANGFHYDDNMENPLSTYFYNGLQNAKDTIMAGVTTVRDCGLADIGFKAESYKFRFPMPKTIISVSPLSITRGHFDFTKDSGHDMRIQYPGLPRTVGDGEVNALKMTRECIGAGADFIKVMASGGVLSASAIPKYPEFNVKELKTIVSEASAQFKKVAAHCHSKQAMENCIAAGISSIEHGTYIDKQIAVKLKENNISLVPTLVVHKELCKNPNGDYRLNSQNKKKLKEVIKVHSENLAIAYDVGVNLLMGTDSGVIRHGINLEELSHLVSIGMDEKEALASGTIKAAEHLNQDKKIGSIEIGKDADLVLSDKNPLDDISYIGDSDNIKLVVRDGKIIKNLL